MRKTPLEEWIARKIHVLPDRELTGDTIRSYQLEKLKAVIDHVSGKSPFYKERLRGISGKDLQSVDDISALPMTTTDDLRYTGPRFLCVSQSDVCRVVTLPTSGNDVAPRRIYFSADDLELTIDFFHHGMTALAHPGQRVRSSCRAPGPAAWGTFLPKRSLARASKGLCTGL